MNTGRHHFIWIFASLLVSVSTPLWATEGGGSSDALGSENYLVGAMPPPGWYGLVYGQHYSADNVIGNDGRSIPIDFRVRANAIAPRLIWVTDQKVLGGSLAFHAVAPLVDLSVAVNGNRDHAKGLGDITVGAALGYHYSDKFHAVYGLDVITPTGKYDRDRLANLGRNYWSVEPVAAFSYLDPDGLNWDLKLMYNFNAKNPATGYTSGQEFHSDYSFGWGLGNGWVVGLGGYFYRQVTDDRQNGESISDNKGRAFAIGPSLKYTSNHGWFVTAKWQQESNVRNRAEGDAYWVKLVVPF